MAKKKSKRAQPRLRLIRGDLPPRPTPLARSLATRQIQRLPTRIYFSRGSSTPIGSSLTTLRSYADWLADDRARRLFVLGHANRRLWDQASRGLADARARAVRDLLIWLGAKAAQVGLVKASRLHDIPADSTHGERQAHRYVELIPAPDGRLAVSRKLPRAPGALRALAQGTRRPPRRLIA